MKNAVYLKTPEYLRNRIDVKILTNMKDYLKWTSKLSYLSGKMFDNNLAAMRKGRLVLTLNKPEDTKIVFLEWRKVSAYQFHYGYTQNKYK